MTEMRKISKLSRNICLSLLLLSAAGATIYPALAEEAAKEDPKDVEYSGIYQGKHVIPDSMAIYCKTDGETMVIEQMTKNEKEADKTKSSALKKCLDKIITQIHHKEAITRAEGVKEFQIILQEQRAQMMTEAVSKSATMSTYSKEKQQTIAAAGEGQTNVEDSTALANVDNNLTDVINSTRALLAEEMKYIALEGLNSVDPAVLMTEEEKEKQESKEGKQDPTNLTVVKTHVEGKEDDTETSSSGDTGDDADDADTNYQEDPNAVPAGNEQEGEQETENYVNEEIRGEYDPTTGQCIVNGKPEKCQDGLYTYGNQKMLCFDDGTCAAYIEEVKVIGDSSKAKEKIKKIDQITQQLGNAEKTMNEKVADYRNSKADYDNFCKKYSKDGTENGEIAFEKMTQEELDMYVSLNNKYKQALQEAQEATQKFLDAVAQAQQLLKS